MGIKIYNTLTRKKSEFIPIESGKVKMYVCGVTVYDLCHIGHARSVVVFDMIYRYFLFKGFDVKYVRNFTDVDDKIINRAIKEKKSADEIAQRYINEFYKDMDALLVLRPTVEPRATQHIPQIIESIKGLIDKGFAYESNGNIYFSVEKFKDYGKLSRRKLDDMIAGARVCAVNGKQHPLDFALWKKSKPGEPYWHSPWGDGRPGWHIECSVMSQFYLGETFDIHGGGQDLIFPHHENEIAQAEALTGKPFVHYWIHNGFVKINKEKMSKSLGNFLTIREILNDYHPEVLRFFLLSNHYRSPIDFSYDMLNKAENNLEKFYSFLLEAERIKNEKPISSSSELIDPFSKQIRESKEEWEKAMDDDFNSAKAIGHLFSLLRACNHFIHEEGYKYEDGQKLLGEAADLIKKFGEVFGIFSEKPEHFIKKLKIKKEKSRSIDPAIIEDLIKKRAVYREKKEWEKADEIRNKLLEMGIQIMDTPKGTTWKVL